MARRDNATTTAGRQDAKIYNGRSRIKRIQVDGIAAIVCAQSIVRPNGFVPSVGDAFQILTYASHSGAIGSVTGTVAGSRTFGLAYNATNLTLNVT